MSVPAEETSQCLADLLSENPTSRLARLRAQIDPGTWLISLAEESEQWVINDLARSLEATAALVELADQIDNPQATARTRRAQAHAFAYANEFDEALESLRASLDAASRAGDDVAAAHAQLAMLHVLNRQGRTDEAIRAGTAALEASYAAGDQTLAAKANANLGVVFRTRNEPEKALACFERARPLFQDVPVALAQIDSNRAEAMLDLNRFDEAERGFRSACRAFEQAGLVRAVAIVEGNLADLMTRQGRLPAALHHFERARLILDGGDAAGDLARLRSEQAEAFAMAGLADEAIDEFHAALPQLDAHGLAVEAARARVGLGMTLLERGRFDEAAEVLTRASAAYEATGHDIGRGRAALALARIDFGRGHLQEARVRLQEALRLLHDRPADTALVRRELAALELADGHPDRAEALLEIALSTARNLNISPLLGELYALRARVRRVQRLDELAIADLRLAVEQFERIRGSLQAERLRMAFGAGRTALHERLVLALLDSDADASIPEAFHVAEQARSRTLLDLVSGAVELSTIVCDDAADPAAAALVRRITARRHELNALYSRVADLRVAPTQGDAAEEWRYRVQACERELNVLESRLGATRGLSGVFARALDLESIARLLPPGTALVEYFRAADEWLAFVVRPHDASVHRRLASPDDICELVERLQFQIDRVQTYDRERAHSDERLVDDARRELQALYDVLIRPLESSLAGVSHLHVVPHELLHGLPFHALDDGETCLLERMHVTVTSSASLLAHLADAHATPTGTALVVGVSDPDLPCVGAETDAVAAALPAARRLVDDDATIARFKEEASHAGVIHVACHGRFAATSPRSSGLRLADGWLTVQDLYGLHLPGSTVVLSGCDTGRAAIEHGDELVGLVRSVFAAGASSLVMSLWALDDDSSKEMMELAYRLWHNDGPDGRRGLAPALRAAQLELRQRRPHPAFWAPFVFIGRP